MNTGNRPLAWHQLPLLWLMIGLLMTSFVGGIAMLMLAYQNPDAEIHSDVIRGSGGAAEDR